MQLWEVLFCKDGEFDCKPLKNGREIVIVVGQPIMSSSSYTKALGLRNILASRSSLLANFYRQMKFVEYVVKVMNYLMVSIFQWFCYTHKVCEELRALLVTPEEFAPETVSFKRRLR